MVVFENEPKATRVSVKRIALTLAIAGAIVVGVAGVAVASDHVAGRGDQRYGSLAEGLYLLEHRAPTAIDCGVIERTDEAPTAESMAASDCFTAAEGGLESAEVVVVRKLPIQGLITVHLRYLSPCVIEVIHQTVSPDFGDIVSFAIHPRVFRYPEGWLVPGGYPESERYYSDVSLH